MRNAALTFLGLAVAAVLEYCSVVVTAQEMWTGEISFVEITRRASKATVIAADRDYIASLSSSEQWPADCDFAGEITLSHPMSLDRDDKYFDTGHLMLTSMSMTMTLSIDNDVVYPFKDKTTRLLCAHWVTVPIRAKQGPLENISPT